MKKRLRIEPTSAWLLAVFLSVATFGLIYFLSTLMPGGDKQMEKILATPDDELHTLADDHTKSASDTNTSTHETTTTTAAETTTHSEHNAHTEKAPTSIPRKWSYAQPQGPEAWGDLDPAFSLCKNGQKQSPINIENVKVQTVRQPFEISYEQSTATLGNDGNIMNIKMAPTNFVRWGTHKYTLQTIRLHSPSEHKIQGTSHEIEIQLIHQDEHGETLIIGAFFDQGERGHPAIDMMLNSIPQQKQDPSKSFSFNPTSLFPKTRDYFSYQGSQTQPPCEENVMWILFRDSSSVSSNQVDQLQTLFKKNARPTQALYGREVFLTGDKR